MRKCFELGAVTLDDQIMVLCLVTDSHGEPVSIEITGVNPDEPVEENGDGNPSADAILDGSTA